MSTIITRRSKVNSAKKKSDISVTDKPHYLVFYIYLNAHHLGRLHEMFQTNEGTTWKEFNRNIAVNKAIGRFNDLFGWINIESMKIWDFFNLNNVEDHLARYIAKGNDLISILEFLTLLCNRAENMWTVIYENRGVVCHHDGYNVFPWVSSLVYGQTWFPMYHYFLQKLNEDDIVRICTAGMMSSCLFIKNHSTEKRSGHAVFKPTHCNKVWFVKYLTFHLKSSQISSKNIPRKVYTYPEGTFPGHIHGLCCNPYHYMTKFEEHCFHDPIIWPKITPQPNTREWEAAGEHVGLQMAVMREKMNCTRHEYYSCVLRYSKQDMTGFTAMITDNRRLEGMKKGLDNILLEIGDVLGINKSLGCMQYKATQMVEQDVAHQKKIIEMIEWAKFQEHV